MMKYKHLLKYCAQCLLSFVLSISASSVIAGDAAASLAKLGSCVACHGADGIGKAPQYPNLKGQKAAYLEKQLKAYKSGARKDPTMNTMAKPLTDADIVDLAAYFANVK
jgi:cytochrome c553